MIESLSVTNFYCFKDRTTISFIAKKERNRTMDNDYCGFIAKNKMNFILFMNKRTRFQKDSHKSMLLQRAKYEMKKIIIATYTIPILYSFNQQSSKY